MGSYAQNPSQQQIPRVAWDDKTRKSGHAARSFAESRNSLPHGMDVLGLDFVEHALLAGLSEWIFVLVEVFFGHLVDVFGRALLSDFLHPSAHFDVAVRIIGINHGDGDARIASFSFPTMQVLL